MAKTPSWSRKTALVRSVLNNIPIYGMDAFKLLVSTYNKIDQLTKRFWWETTKDSGNYFTPMSWDLIYQPKENGGL